MKELSLHLLDIAQNSVRAKAENIRIIVEEKVINNSFQMIVEDDGTGIPDEIYSQVTNPFVTTRTTRKIGLGLPLLKSTCEQCDGDLNIIRKKDEGSGTGTKIIATMAYNHIDRPPLGDIASSIVCLLSANENIHISYEHIYNDNKFIVDSKEIATILDGMPMNNPEVFNWLKAYIKENIDEIK